MKYDMFISYRRSERELVAQVVRRLEARGVNAWYDAKIEGGADFREAIVEALTDSEMLVIFFSEDCNNSRQLKKELAVADSLEKPVVPILIEDTRPRGAYLYELADRNWIQMWPDPAQKIDELVDHLVALAGKSAAAPAPAAKAAAPISLARKAEASDAIASTDLGGLGASAPAAQAAEEIAAPPRLSDAYVGKVHERSSKAAGLRDLAPFKWLDLLIVLPATALFFLAGSPGPHPFGPEQIKTSLAALALVLIGVAALYGAIAFPIRYYLRRRSVGSALGSYLLSTAILYVVFMAGLIGATMAGLFPGYLSPLESAIRAAAFWLGFTAVAFVIYGVLSGQRALRSFRSNLKKI